MTRYSLDVYNEAFFGPVQEEGLKHAEWFMPLLLKTIPFTSFVDAGCGTGYFLKWCEDHKLPDCLGLEGAEWAVQHPLSHTVVPYDLRDPFPTTEKLVYENNSKFDLVLSLEVAEHIEAEYAEIFARNLTLMSDTIVMTAAPPGQGGTSHVNEQPQGYWEEIFRNLGYLRDASTEAILVAGVTAARESGKHVAPWLPGNLMVYRKMR